MTLYVCCVRLCERVCGPKSGRRWRHTSREVRLHARDTRLSRGSATAEGGRIVRDTARR